MEYQEKLNLLKDIVGGDGEAGIISSIIQNTSPSKKFEIVDLGCGDGKFTKKYLELVPDIEFNLHLADIDPNALKIAAGRFPLAQLYAGLETIPRQKQFDIAISVQSLYYLGPLEETVELISDHLKPGGTAIFVVWSEECDLFKIARDQSHQELLTATTLKTKIEEIPSITNIEEHSNVGEVLHERIGALEPTQKSGFFELLRRGAPSNDDMTNQQVYYEKLACGAYSGKRENSVISARRL